MDTQAPTALEAALPRFLRRCDADTTRVSYERELLRFLSWIDWPLKTEVLFDYRDHLRNRKLGPTTVRWRTTVARAFLRFAEEQGHVEPGVVGDFKPPKGHSGFAPRILTKAELRGLLEAPDRRTRRGRRDAAILACLGIGGLRASEVCRLDAEHVSVKRNRVVLLVHGKGRKQRIVPLVGRRWSKLFRSYLALWSESRQLGQPLFWCGHPGSEDKRLTPASIDYLVRRTSTSIGKAEISAHVLRHTAASLAIDAGESLHRLRDRLGHSSVLVTSRYLHVTH